MEKFFKAHDSGASAKASAKLQTQTSETQVCQSLMDTELEYKGYYKFGKVLGRGRFGTVIECVRKSDNQPIAMKLFKCSGKI